MFWDEPIPAAVTAEELEERNSNFTVADVKEWVEKHDHLQGRFRFFDVYAKHSSLYIRVARPLLSMRTTGSIDVERVAKPFKHNILRKKRNRLSDQKGRVLFRAAQNLRYLMKEKMEWKGKIYDGTMDIART